MNQIQDLLNGCRNNNRHCQEKLYYKFYPALFALCKKFFAHDHEVKTALNNGMLRVFKSLDRYDESKGELFPWVYTVVRNAALTLARDRNSFFTLELNDQLTEAASYEPFSTSVWDEIFESLDKLPPATRVVCSLFYLEGFSVEEIATELHIKEGSVKWHLHESRNRLRQIFRKSNQS